MWFSDPFTAEYNNLVCAFSLVFKTQRSTWMWSPVLQGFPCIEIHMFSYIVYKPCKVLSLFPVTGSHFVLAFKRHIQSFPSFAVVHRTTSLVALVWENLTTLLLTCIFRAVQMGATMFVFKNHAWWSSISKTGWYKIMAATYSFYCVLLSLFLLEICARNRKLHQDTINKMWWKGCESFYRLNRQACLVTLWASHLFQIFENAMVFEGVIISPIGLCLIPVWFSCRMVNLT